MLEYVNKNDLTLINTLPKDCDMLTSNFEKCKHIMSYVRLLNLGNDYYLSISMPSITSEHGSIINMMYNYKIINGDKVNTLMTVV